MLFRNYYVDYLLCSYYDLPYEYRVGLKCCTIRIYFA